MTFPTELNGHAVMAVADRHDFSPGEVQAVMVKRNHPMHPYVVASWWEELGTRWNWGHYHTNYAEARADFAHLTGVVLPEGRIH